MTTLTTILDDGSGAPQAPAATGAVSWSAILAGATAAAALSLILLVLGVGLGVAAGSPWTASGPSVEAMTWATTAWILFAAFASSGLGGYLAGRLRCRWPGVRNDEVYFRDTAHGFLAWAVATLATAAVLTSVVGVVLGTAGGSVEQISDAITAEARRNQAYASLWMFVSLLLGAFSASLMATLGGRQRDLP